MSRRLPPLRALEAFLRVVRLGSARAAAVELGLSPSALSRRIGTLEEFFEAWTAGYLGMHTKPIVMLDSYGHYDGLLAWLRGLVGTGYVAEGAMRCLTVVDDVDAALAACAPRLG